MQIPIFSSRPAQSSSEASTPAAAPVQSRDGFADVFARLAGIAPPSDPARSTNAAAGAGEGADAVAPTTEGSETHVAQGAEAPTVGRGASEGDATAADAAIAAQREAGGAKRVSRPQSTASQSQELAINHAGLAVGSDGTAMSGVTVQENAARPGARSEAGALTQPVRRAEASGAGTAFVQGVPQTRPTVDRGPAGGIRRDAAGPNAPPMTPVISPALRGGDAASASADPGDAVHRTGVTANGSRFADMPVAGQATAGRVPDAHGIAASALVPPRADMRGAVPSTTVLDANAALPTGLPGDVGAASYSHAVPARKGDTMPASGYPPSYRGAPVAIASSAVPDQRDPSSGQVFGKADAHAAHQGTSRGRADADRPVGGVASASLPTGVSRTGMPEGPVAPPPRDGKGGTERVQVVVPQRGAAIPPAGPRSHDATADPVVAQVDRSAGTRQGGKGSPVEQAPHPLLQRAGQVGAPSGPRAVTDPGRAAAVASGEGLVRAPVHPSAPVHPLSGEATLVSPAVRDPAEATATAGTATADRRAERGVSAFGKQMVQSAPAGMTATPQAPDQDGRAGPTLHGMSSVDAVEVSAGRGSAGEAPAPITEPRGPEARHAGPVSPQSAADARGDAGRVLALQTVEAVRQAAGNGPLEVALRPEDLGRLRIVFTQTEAGLHVAISADRAETADLLRRHADMLGTDLRQLGYDDVAFDFGGDGSGPNGRQHRAEAEAAGGVADNATPDGLPRKGGSPPQGGAGLDLRL